MNISNNFIPINLKKSATQIIDHVFVQLSKSLRKKDIEQIARATGFIQRNSSKISGFIFLTSFLALNCHGVHSSLEKMAEMITRIDHRIKISAQGLMKRINTKKAVEFLKIVFSKLLEEKLDEFPGVSPQLLALFDKIYIQDSSSVILHEKLQEHFKGSGGRSSKASAKFDVMSLSGNK